MCGVPADKIRPISSAVDKLDKVVHHLWHSPYSDPPQLPWAEVKKEMTAEKGLDEAAADKIGEYVKHKGNLHFRTFTCVFTTFSRWTESA